MATNKNGRYKAADRETRRKRVEASLQHHAGVEIGNVQTKNTRKKVPIP